MNMLDNIEHNMALLLALSMRDDIYKQISIIAEAVEGLAQYLKQQEVRYTTEWEPLLRMKRGE